MSAEQYFDEFQQKIGIKCVSLGDMKWAEVEDFLVTIPTNIERVEFLSILRRLPDDGVSNGIIHDAQRHNRNYNEFVMPLTRKRAELLLGHFDLDAILKQEKGIADHKEALTFLHDTLDEYLQYHPNLYFGTGQSDEWRFKSAVEQRIQRRNDLAAAGSHEPNPIDILRKLLNWKRTLFALICGTIAAVYSGSVEDAQLLNRVWSIMTRQPSTPTIPTIPPSPMATTPVTAPAPKPTARPAPTATPTPKPTATPKPKPPVFLNWTKNVARQGVTATGIFLKAGDRLTVKAKKGTIKVGSFTPPVGPDGTCCNLLGRNLGDLGFNELSQYNHAAILYGVAGEDGATDEWDKCGSYLNTIIEQDGELLFRLNDKSDSEGDANAFFKVTIKIQRTPHP